MCSDGIIVNKSMQPFAPCLSNINDRKERDTRVGFCNDDDKESVSNQQSHTTLMSKEDSLRLIDKNKEINESEKRSMPLNASFLQRAEEEAKLITQERFRKSDLGVNVNNIPRFQNGEVMLGRRLGKGEFSSVEEVRDIQIRSQSRRYPGIRGFPSPLPKLSRSDTVAANDKESRNFIAEHCHRRSGDARYAIKMLRKDTLQSRDRIILGLCNLANETRVLANLEHPNIIKLRAISSSDPFSGRYFLILDRLYDTLTKRFDVWKIRHRKLYSFWGRLKDRGAKKRLEFYESRIEKAFDLSAAVEHCHAYNIIHRDIKPENIGFDLRGDIKIFDFGLARELNSDERTANGTFHLSKMTGSLRFMAPEVWFGKPYNSACDVYSLGIVLWAILALKKPYSFSKWKDEQHFAREILCPGGARPELGARWPLTLKHLLSQSWIHDQHERLSAAEVTRGLRDELVRLRHGDDSDIPDHRRRRSTFIFEPRGNTERKEHDPSSMEFLDRSMKSQNSMPQSFKSLGSDKDVESHIP